MRPYLLSVKFQWVIHIPHKQNHELKLLKKSSMELRQQMKTNFIY